MTLGIRGLLAVGLAGLLAVAGLIAGLLVVRLVGAEAESLAADQQRQRAQAIADQLVAVCEPPGGDPAARLQTDVEARTRASEDLLEIIVVDGGFRRLAGAPSRGPAPRDPLLIDAFESRQVAWARDADEQRIVVPAALPDGRRVAVYFQFSLAAARAAVAGRQRTVLFYLGVDLFAVLLFGIYLGGRYLVRPIHDLTRATERIAAGELRPEIVPWVRGAAELEQLGEAFRAMVERLAAQRAAVESAQESLVRSEKLATVGRLAAGVAHEIGNPLAAVLGYVEYLRDDRGTPPEQQADLLARVEKEILRMRATVQDLLDFSRPSPGRAEPVQLADVVRSAIELVGYQRRFKKVSIEVNAAASAPPALADPGRLRQVLVNLLLNAADAMDGAGVIRVHVGPDDDGVRVSVADEGPGIPAEERAHLFDPFYSTKPSGQGTGLGLAICQRLVEEAGGRIGLEETIEGAAGATFTIWLPAAR